MWLLLIIIFEPSLIIEQQYQMHFPDDRVIRILQKLTTWLLENLYGYSALKRTELGLNDGVCLGGGGINLYN
jgi:hypothetical protein